MVRIFCDTPPANRDNVQRILSRLRIALLPQGKWDLRGFEFLIEVFVKPCKT